MRKIQKQPGYKMGIFTENHSDIKIVLIIYVYALI